MVEYLKTKKGYFYKILKNSEKKRISQEEYNKKHKKRIGGGGISEITENHNETEDDEKSIELSKTDCENCICMICLSNMNILINNLPSNIEKIYLIFKYSNIDIKIVNLPSTIKEIVLEDEKYIKNIKKPFGTIISIDKLL